MSVTKDEDGRDRNKLFESTYQAAKFYLGKGLNVIPVRPGDKRPLVRWERYQREVVNEEELKRWFSSNANIAIVTGKVSGNLIVLDFDGRDVFKWFVREILPGLPDLVKYSLSNTWVVRTGKGFHVYLRLVDGELRTKPRLRPGLDIKAEGGYVIAPPSVHPSGARYEFLTNPLRKDIQTISREELETLLKRLAPQEMEERAPGSKDLSKELRDDQVRRIVSLLEPFYRKGYRDLLVFSFLGLLIKAGVSYESARKVIEKLAVNKDDEELRQRLNLVEYHYGRVVERKPIEKLLGAKGLRETMESVLREEGLPEEEIAKRVSQTLAELNATLGISKSQSVWLERRGGLITKWVYPGRQGVYLFRKRGRDEEPLVKIISSARIGGVKRLEITGLPITNLYVVSVDSETISGTADEIVQYIKRYYGVEPGQEYSLIRLLDGMAEEEEEMFYSPGPWVVEGKIVLAKEPGYTPPWKPSIVLEEASDVPRRDKEDALRRLSQLVNAYRDPRKTSLILSYAAVAPLAYYIKYKIGIFFHLIIHGLENTGKSLLLDLLRVLYGTPPEADPFPGSDYQARRMLATTTYPALLDEIGGLIAGYVKEQRSALETIELLHRSATQILLRQAGGHSYGGYYLAIRAVIAATNTDVSLIPWQLDKFFLVMISKKEGIDVSRARGCTPRTMPENVRRALRRLGWELLEEIEGLLPEIDGLAGMEREEIRRRILIIGYEAWKRLYERYGLAPFPEPAEPETQLEKQSLVDEIRDIFTSYVLRAERGELRDVRLRTFNPVSGDEEWEKEEAVEKDLGFIEETPEGRFLVCKTSFLTKFKEYMVREYGLPRVGWKKLVEMLGMRRTSRRSGEGYERNLLVYKLP